MRDGRVLMAKADRELMGVLRLAARKPWAIDPEYFTPVSRPVYLTDMAVAPEHQGKGVVYRGTALVYFERLVGSGPGGATAPPLAPHKRER
jgi:hypothetical protein